MSDKKTTNTRVPFAKLIIAPAGIWLIAGTTACSGNVAMMGGAPDFEMRGSSEGIDAFYQGQLGTIEGAKTAEGSAQFAQETYRRKEIERSRRSSMKPFSNLFGRNQLNGGQ